MTSTLIDSNVLIDILGSDEMPHRRWSLTAMRSVAESGPVVFSAVVWAELASTSIHEDMLHRVFARFDPRNEDFPFAASYAAGLAHRKYVARGGRRERTLPDLMLGAHAMVHGHQILTRGPARYRTYFPTVNVIAPDTHP